MHLLLERSMIIKSRQRNIALFINLSKELKDLRCRDGILSLTFRVWFKRAKVHTFKCLSCHRLMPFHGSDTLSRPRTLVRRGRRRASREYGQSLHNTSSSSCFLAMTLITQIQTSHLRISSSRDSANFDCQDLKSKPKDT